MGLLDRFIKRKAPEEGPSYEIVERQICLEDTKDTIIVKIQGRELFSGAFFRASLEDNDYSFSRFYINNEELPKTHFAPSLKEAISWFLGKSGPKDGYGTIVWGEKMRYQCKYCTNFKDFSISITKVEKLKVFTDMPFHREIVGWRVIEVETEIFGKGIPTKILTKEKTYPIIKWYSEKKEYSCLDCAEKLVKLGREAELEDLATFPPD